MATRKKKKQRTMQLMASAALLSTTVAPYVISAEELTVGQEGNTNETLQNSVSNTTQTSGDSATIAPVIENTIDNGSEITSSGGNTTTEAIGNGIVNSTIVNEVEAINTTLAAPTTLSTEAVPATQTDIIWRQDISHTMEADPNGPMADFITNYLNPYFTNSEIVQVGNAHYIQMTLVEKAYGFQTLQYLDADGNKHDVEVISSTGEKMEQVRVVRIPLIQDENGISKVFVDSGDLSYGAYTLFFNFEIPELSAQPEQPTESARVDITHTMKADPTGPMAEFITNYLNPYFTKPQLVTIGEKQFIEMALIEKAYGFQTLQYLDADGNKHDVEVISSTGEKMEQVRVIRIPLIQDENGVSKVFVDSGDLGYGAYTLFFNFNTTSETPQPEVGTVEENVWFTATHSSAGAKSAVDDTLGQANVITRSDGKYAQIQVTFNSNAKLDTSNTYKIIEQSEDGNTVTIEVLLEDGYKAQLPFNYYPMPSMPSYVMKNMATVLFAFEKPVDGTIVSQNKPFAITNLSDPFYTKNYTKATENITVIEKADGNYARIAINLNTPIFSTISNGEIVKVTDSIRVIEAKLNEANETSLNFVSAGNIVHTVTYNVSDDIEHASLPAPYEGIGSYLDVTEKTAIQFKYKENTPNELIELLIKTFIESPYVNREGDFIGLGMTLQPTDEVTTITLKNGRSTTASWSTEDATDMYTKYSGALTQNFSFELTLADGSTETIYINGFIPTPVVTQPEEPIINAKHIEKNVNFQFTAGADFETGAPADSYLKAFVTQADLIIAEDGKPYADITFGGHSYAGTTIKVGSADGVDAEIITSTGSAETKDLVRTVRVALDEDYRADIFFGSARGNYTFKFDLVEEETKFNFTSGTAQDAYFSLWVPRADLVETATGDKYAYITLAGHSYAVGAITVDELAADIVSSTGSAETKDLTRVVRVKLDATNKAAIALDGGTHGAYTFTFDFSKQVETPFADTLTTDYQNVEFDITAGMPAMFIVPGAIEVAQAKKVADGIAFSIQTTKAESARGSYKTFIVKQNSTVIKEVSAENNELAEFTVASLDGLTIDVVYVAGGAETTYTGKVAGAKLVVAEPEQPTNPSEPKPTTPDTSAVNPGDYTTGSDLDEAIFTEQVKKVKFTFKSLVKDIPSAAALAVIVPEVTVTKKDDKYEVTLQVNPVRTDRLFVAQNGQEVATVNTTNGAETTLTFTVDNLDHLFFYVDGVSGTATGSIETVIGAEVTGYEVLDITEEPTNPVDHEPEQPTNPVDPEPEQPTNPVDPKPEQPTNPVDPKPEQPTNPVDPKPEQPTTPINVTHSFTAVEVTPGTFGSVPGSFIENYLKPYFTNAQLVTVNNKKYIELTLIGKAYGVVSFQGAEWISSTGEKLDQVRVIRIPPAKASTHRVDAGEYGIYDLTFTFGVTDEQLVVEQKPTTPEKPVEKPAENVIVPPSKPSNNANAIITKPTDLKVAKNTPTTILFTFGTATQPEVQAVINTIKEMIDKPTIKVKDNNTFEVHFKIKPKSGVKRLRVMKDGKELGIWTASSLTARVASLLPFFASNTDEITFETDSLEGITFEAVDTNDKTVVAIPAVEVDKTIANTTTPSTPGTGTVTGGGSVVTPPAASDVENRESINYKMVSDPNGPMADFMTNYMTPYFSNAELVTVGGKNYIELTLTGKAYGFQNLRVTGGYKVISSEGEKMDQVRVIRFPATKDVTIHVDSGDLGYGAYDLLFTFELSEEQLKNAAAAGTGGITAVQTITPQIVSEGDVKFTIPAEASAIVTYAKKISAKLVNGQYNVDVTLMTETDLDTFIVKQDEKEIARWDKKNKSASLTTVANTNVLSFTVESLENLTFIATTKTRTLEAKVGAELPKQEVVQAASKDGRVTMTYTMTADPNGPMADFIGNYLAPYFSDAIYVTESGNEFVEMTLTGKAYGFAKLQLIDVDGKYVDIDVVSSTGEKMDQVRVIRFPLVQDKDGITKIFVDSGDLGYGAYTLFFKYNVPAKSGNPVATTITNPFKDIGGVYSKDDILALHAAGITTGTTENTFSPNASMTRAQFAVMVARALGVSSTTETKFKDVQGKWYAAEVQALAELGIITGVSETKFKPGDKITRQQAAVMIHRMLQYKGYTNKTTADALNFKDNAKVADYAKEALAELQAQGIMTGSDGKVNPKANLTRAQMAKILKNAADLVGLLD
ncbi:MAG: S-layer homology domain-containing protein [Solibacillus sp.]